jgi:para-nitrobenzyl esterase
VNIPPVSVEGGVVEGVRAGDALHYRGIPYAHAERFGTPGPPRPWVGVRDGSRHGPDCPQAPFRIAAVMGEPQKCAESEDCLTLSVTTPLVDSSRPRPVMVWFHGGAYVVGAGSHEWYRGDRLAVEGDVVVVSANYRLGLFGYLRLEGASPGNLGLLDQMAALAWVKANIAAFGGDPAQVTVFGESAGGHSVTALLSSTEARGLFRRAIVQSAHLGLGFSTIRGAERVGRVVRECLGDTDPRSASVEALLAAQDAAASKLAGPGGLNSSPIFGPIAGVHPLPAPAEADIARAILQPDVDLLIGTTRSEMRAFFDTNPSLARLRRLPLVGRALFDALVRAVTARVFTAPARRLADAQARGGAAVYRYLFEWTPPREAFGACHTIDLPFVFGDEAAWHASPMLGGAPWKDVDVLGRQMRRAWTRFARHGDPNAPEDPAWPRHSAGAGVGRRFR